mmetsp:Transcript_19121/g.31683  ORF Transcript_19121/g.31683 Transcript_19121/m.31683 type:complete len:453 (+) Transcript_19121:240-1598(+)
MDSASILHLDQVSLGVDTKEITVHRLVVGDWDLSKEHKVYGQVIIVITSSGVLLVFKQPLWEGNDQLHLNVTRVIQEEWFRSEEHELVHGHELGGRSGKTSEETSAVHGRIGEGRGGHEGRALHQGTAVNIRVHERHHSTASHFVEELFVKLSSKELEVVLEGHVGPDGLVLEPTWRESHHSSHIVTLSLQTGRQKVHVELFITESRSQDTLVHVLHLLLVVLNSLHVTDGTFKEEWESSDSHGKSVDSWKANTVLSSVLLPLGDIKGEVAWSNSSVTVISVTGTGHLHGTFHTELGLGNPAIQHGDHCLGRDGGFVAREVVLNVVTVRLTGGGNDIPVVEEVFWNIKRHFLRIGISTGIQSIQSPIDSGDHLEEFIWDDDRSLELLDNIANVFQSQVHFVRFWHTTSDHTWKTVHGIVPSRTSTFVLDTHTVGITHRKLDGSEQKELGNGG